MKKITLLKSAACIGFMMLTQISRSQTWDLVDNGGYGTFNNQTFALAEFKGYFVAASGQGNNPGASIFLSSTGDPGTWSEQASFTALVGPNDFGAKELATTNAAGGWIATGTKNYTSGPGVYNSFDGGLWSNIGAIPYPNPLGNYYEVSSMLFFNPSGADDTLYVAVQNGMDGAEIWKNYAAGGTWSQVFDFPSYTTARINDMVKFNNKIYACTDDALIYESADGNNWTMNMAADTGFNDPGSFSFTAMTVFQNRLYVAVKNSTTGTQIWNTPDGLTWNPVNVDGFTNGNNMTEITDLMVADGKLWVSAYSWITGGAIMPSGGEGRGGSYYTYIYSSDGVTFTNSNNDGFGSTNRYGNLGFYQNFVYQGSDNSGWGSGELWRICTPPTPNIVSSATSICEYAPVYFSDTLYSAITTEWYVDGTLWSTAANFTHNPVSLGVQTIKLIERNGTCADSTTFLLTVNANPVSSATTFQTLCYADSVVLMDTITGGTAPFTFAWDNGSTILTGQTISFPALTGTSYTVTVTDANGCMATSNSGFSPTASTDLVGHAGYSGGNVASGNAVAFRYYGTYTYFDTAQVASLDGLGNFTFTALNSGDYLIKIFADTLLYPTLNATYFGDTWAWDTATVVTHGCSAVDTANVTMVEELGLTAGPGNLRGRIIEDIGFGSMATWGSGMGRAPGEPIPGIDVKLGKNPGGAMMGSTTTSSATASDGGGFYYFTNVPLNVGVGYYTVYVDIPGLERDSSYNITVTATNNQFMYLDYKVDSTTIFIVPNAGVGISNPDVAVDNKFNIYPNPFKGETKIEYHLTKDANVSLNVYSVVGEKIRTMVNEKQQRGDYKYNLANLNAGVYFVTLSIDGNTSTQRIVQVK